MRHYHGHVVGARMNRRRDGVADGNDLQPGGDGRGQDGSHAARTDPLTIGHLADGELGERCGAGLSIEQPPQPGRQETADDLRIGPVERRDNDADPLVPQGSYRRRREPGFDRANEGVQRLRARPCSGGYRLRRQLARLDRRRASRHRQQRGQFEPGRQRQHADRREDVTEHRLPAHTDHTLGHHVLEHRSDGAPPMRGFIGRDCGHQRFA